MMGQNWADQALFRWAGGPPTASVTYGEAPPQNAHQIF